MDRFVKGATISEPEKRVARSPLLAVGGIISAVLASTCCVLPLVLVTLGVGGAWVSGLTALAPYQGYAVGAAILCLSVGFWAVYWRPRKACVEGSACRSMATSVITKVLLWSGLIIIAIVLTDEWWIRYF